MIVRKKAALVACSDPLSEKRVQECFVLRERLQEEGVETELVKGFFDGVDPEPALKGRLLSDCFRDADLDYIFDVSGGDLANLVLPYLDYEAVRNSRALFFGYSDLSTVINAIIAKTGRPAVNYQIRNILYDHAAEQLRYFREKILVENPVDNLVGNHIGNLVDNTLANIVSEDLELQFLRGSSMEGRILGGNLRCFLKLAGTEYWPDMEGSILLLESLGGGVYQMMTALEQYRQLGVFDQVKGVILGTFTKMQQEQLKPTIEELVLKMVPENVPVAKTRYVGHYSDARAVVLGKKCCIF